MTSEGHNPQRALITGGKEVYSLIPSLQSKIDGLIDRSFKDRMPPRVRQGLLGNKRGQRVTCEVLSSLGFGFSQAVISRESQPATNKTLVTTRVDVDTLPHVLVIYNDGVFIESKKDSPAGTLLRRSASIDDIVAYTSVIEMLKRKEVGKTNEYFHVADPRSSYSL